MYELYSLFMPDELSGIAYPPNCLTCIKALALQELQSSIDLECYNSRVLRLIGSRSPYMYSTKGSVQGFCPFLSRKLLSIKFTQFTQQHRNYQLSS